MFGKAFIFMALFCASLAQDAAPQVQQHPQESSLNYVYEINPDGSYVWSFENPDGSKAQQEGKVEARGEESAQIVSGSYSFPGDDGKTYEIKYVADENGYQPIGDHLPVAPPIPEAIQRSLDYLAKNAPPTQEV